MDIFVDTGIVIGYADSEDLNFHQPCNKFVNGHRFRDNSYYSNINVITLEVSRKERQRCQVKTKTAFRRFIQRAKIFLEHLIDASYEEHGLYIALFQQIHSTLIQYGTSGHPMDRDARLLTSSYLWEIEVPDLISPNFLTTDNNDIYQNRDKIEQCANIHLPRNSNLKIEFITNVV